MKLIIQTKFLINLYINMDFLMKQQSIMLYANCQLIQCTHITDLLYNLKGLLDSMIIKVFGCDAKYLVFTDVPKSSNIHPWYTTSTCVTITWLSTVKELC